MDGLNRDELVALAACVREMMTADAFVSHDESASAAHVGLRLGLPRREWDSAWSEAIRRFPNRDASYAAALAIERPKARERFYELLHHVADSDGFTGSEWDLLEALDKAWHSTT